MMKKGLLALVVILGGLAAYKLLSRPADKPAENKDQPLSISKNSDVFNNSFSTLMNGYYSLQAALVDWDSVKADKSAATMVLAADSLPLLQLKADSGILLTARSLAAAVSSEAKGLTGETGITRKRRAFNMLSDELYNLIRVVRYDREKIYHIKCPMAFNDSEEGYWLANSSKVVNPYLGSRHPVYKNKMLGCGEISDSLDFSKK